MRSLRPTLKNVVRNVGWVARRYYSKRSFSQSGEDIILRHLFDILGIAKPSFIDIGAHHPFYFNNTQIFYDRGSRGINIEPDPDLISPFLKLRKKDINLNCGVGPKNGSMEFYVMSVKTLNTFSREAAENAEKEGFKIERRLKIPIMTLGDILNRYHGGVFPDLLTLDVEGWDLEILKTVDYKKTSPKVICVETVSFSQRGFGQKQLEIKDFLTDQGYFVYADTNINTIFVKKERWTELPKDGQ